MQRRTFLKGAVGLLASGMTGWTVAARSFDQLERTEAISRIPIVGLGGAGCRIVSRLAQEGMGWNRGCWPDLYAIDTDRSSLDRVDSRVSSIWLPMKYESCVSPQIARQTAWTYRNRVSHIWRDINLVFFVSGSGGTGIGFSQAFSWQARQGKEIIALPLISMPFSWEIHPVPLEHEVRRLERATNDCYILLKPEEYNSDALLIESFNGCDDFVLSELRSIGRS